MESASRIGRIIGVLIAIQMVGSGMVNFALERPLINPPGFLVNAAAHPQQLALAALLGLVTEPLVWLGIAITAFAIFYQRTQRMALWFVALAVVSLTVAVVENIGVMSMISLSQAYMKASAVEREQLETAKVIVVAARNWPHVLDRVILAGAIFVFYSVLYRFALIPRVIAGFGLIASPLMAIAMAMPIFGHAILFPMLAPMGLSHLILVVWLLTKGFRDQPGPSRKLSVDLTVGEGLAVRETAGSD